jgi:hypothetical protein
VALIYNAVLNPSKLGLLSAWLPTTVVRCEQFELVVVRVVGAEALGEHTLTGSWADGGPAVLASVRRL